MLAEPVPMPAGRIGVAPDPASLHPCTDCDRLNNGVYCTHFQRVMPEPATPNACVRFKPKEPLTPWS